MTKYCKLRYNDSLYKFIIFVSRTINHSKIRCLARSKPEQNLLYHYLKLAILSKPL